MLESNRKIKISRLFYGEIEKETVSIWFKVTGKKNVTRCLRDFINL